MVSIAFPSIPSETSRVSETPLFELLNEEDPEPLQNHCGESSVVGSLCVSAGATLAGLSWTLLVPSTLSLRLIESSSPAISSSVFYLEFPFYCTPCLSYGAILPVFSWSSSRCPHFSRASGPLSPQTPLMGTIAQLSNWLRN